MQTLLPDAAAQTAFGARLAALVPNQFVVYLNGDLGTGKTTLARGILRGLGHQGPARSPTYTLIEPYEIGRRRVYHLDLYRLGDPEELDYLGLRDLLSDAALWLVEWPERGAGLLPAADLVIGIEHLPQGRRLSLSPQGAVGHAVSAGLDPGSAEPPGAPSTRPAPGSAEHPLGAGPDQAPGIAPSTPGPW